MRPCEGNVVLFGKSDFADVAATADQRLTAAVQRFAVEEGSISLRSQTGSPRASRRPPRLIATEIWRTAGGRAPERS